MVLIKGKRKSNADLDGKALKRLNAKTPNPKKQKQRPSGTASASQSEVTPQIPVANGFGVLTEEEAKDISPRTEPPAVEKQVKAPPIVVTSVSDLASFRTQLKNCKETCNLKVSFQVGRRGECRLLTESLQDHQTFVGYLKNHKHNFYTYDAKNARPFKVVIKGLSNDLSVDEIKNELKVLLGFAPSQVIPMKKKSNGSNPRFGLTSQFYLIHFNRNEINNLKLLDKVQFLFHVRVKWEHFKKHGGNGQNLTQCRRCQAFGHGTDHCAMVPKCMVCGDSSHDKDACPVKEITQFKCANCGGNHKSNFWECPIRKKVLDSRAKHQKKTNLKTIQSSGTLNSTFVKSHFSSEPNSSTINDNTRVGGNTFTNPNVSYARVASGLPTIASGTASNFRTASVLPIIEELPAISFDNVSASNASGSSDLGEVTLEKLTFLQNSLFGLIQTMSNATSMIEAIQIGLKFANDVVLALKFNHGSK